MLCASWTIEVHLVEVENIIVKVSFSDILNRHVSPSQASQTIPDLGIVMQLVARMANLVDVNLFICI